MILLTKETMASCLVQQLFRQKIGLELDSNLIDEVLFPMLRPRKHPSNELLQDIKLTSGILVAPEKWRPPTSNRVNVLPFTSIPEHWNYVRAPGLAAPPGKHTSKLLRKKIRRYNWGTIDILNELRELEYPQIGYRPTYFEDEECGEGEFDDAYIRLEEDESLPPNSWSVAQRCQNRVAIEGRTRFVNNFMDDTLGTGKCLTWEGGVLGCEPCKLSLNPLVPVPM
jgi:hypothetical protein